MYPRGGRSFSRGGPGGAYAHTGGRRRFRGQYFRTRTSPSRINDARDDELSGPPSHNHQNQHGSEQQTHQSNYNNHNNSNNRNSRQQRHQNQESTQQQNDLDEIKDLCFKLSNELEIVKERIEEIASSLDQLASSQTSLAQTASLASTINGNDNNVKKKRIKVLNKQRPLDRNEQVADVDAPLDSINNERDVKRRNPIKRRQELREPKDKQDATTNPRPLPTAPVRGDDSTTQAADPSSEDKIEGEEGQADDGQRRVFRRRKQQFNKRRFYNNRRRRNDSSERNSNDTSPQNEMNVDYRSTTNKSSSTNRRDKLSNGRKRSFPELSEAEMGEIVQVLKRDFFAPELEAVKNTVDTKGPSVAQELISSILDHAMCDVTSPTKLSEIASHLSQLIVSEHGGPEFQQGFYGALSTISNREDDIAIDAPRYMDTLGQILGESICPMNTTRHRQLLKRFLIKSLNSYNQKSQALLLASTMRGIARFKEDRFAKDVWDVANLTWSNFLPEDTNIDEFVEAEDVKFTIRTFSPLPLRPKKTPEELEKFADDITNLVEKRCTPQTLEELVRDLELDTGERVDFLGTLIYAIVRGCLTLTDSGDYKLDTEALNKYSSILNGKSQLVLSPINPIIDGDAKKPQPSKKETFDAIALRALTALTKLWHQHNCPQNLMSTILLALHNHGAASYDALKTWLNSEDLKNIPGIGAARLNSKRCIEDLGASRG